MTILLKHDRSLPNGSELNTKESEKCLTLQDFLLYYMAFLLYEKDLTGIFRGRDENIYTEG